MLNKYPNWATPESFPIHYLQPSYLWARFSSHLGGRVLEIGFTFCADHMILATHVYY